MTSRLVLILLAASCGSPLPLRIRDATTGKDALEDMPEAVSEACDLLGLACETTDDDYGSVRLTLIDAPGTLTGEGFAFPPCRPSAWAHPEALPIAHELGHALGLGHSSRRSNLMAPVEGGTELTDHQLRKLERHADRIAACR